MASFSLEPIRPKGPLTKANKGRVIAEMRDFAVNVVNRMQKYPPVPGSRYRRTGNLGRRWTFNGPKVIAADLVVEVGNNADYAPFVQGLKTRDPKQTKLSAQRGWPSLETVSIEEFDKARPKIEDALS